MSIWQGSLWQGSLWLGSLWKGGLWGVGVGVDYTYFWELTEDLLEYSGMVGTVERDSAASYIDTDSVLQIADGDETPFSHAPVDDETGATSITGDFTDLAADLIDDASILDGYLSTGNLVIVEDDAGLFAYGYMGAASGAGCEIYKDYDLATRGWNAIATGFNTAGITAFDVYTNLMTATGSTAQPRFEALGLLSEGEGTNWCLQSNDFDTTWANVGGSTDAQDETGPDGIINSAWTITDPGGGTAAGMQQLNVVCPVAGTYTYSALVKEGTSTGFTLRTYDGASAVKGDVDYTWTAGVPVPTLIVGTSTVEQLGSSDWWRILVHCPNVVAGQLHRVFLHPTKHGTDPGASVTTIFYGVQFEATPYATSYIPTTIIPVTRTADSHTWPMSTAFKNLMGDVADSPFTMVCEWTPKFDYGDTGGDEAVISLKNGVDLFYTDENGNVISGEGTGTSTVDNDYVAGTTYIFALRVYLDGTMKFEVGEKHDDVWTWDATPAAYDGSFNPSTDFILGYLNQYPFNIKDIYFYDSAKTQTWIEGNF